MSSHWRRRSEFSRGQVGVLPAYVAAVCRASSKKQVAPEHLERLQNAPFPEDRKLVRPLDHAREIRIHFHFNSRSQGFFGGDSRRCGSPHLCRR